MSSASPVIPPQPEPVDGKLRGVRLCAFESRKGDDMRRLIEKHGGTATIAPSMRELPIGDNPAALAYGDELLAGRIDVTLFLTGVGTRALRDVLLTKYDEAAIHAAWGAGVVIVRGPKPAAVLREWKVRIDHHVPEPNTWRELLALVDEKVPIAGKRVAVQEYGVPNQELLDGLAARGAEVVRVPVYRWALPEDVGPLEAAVRDVVAGRFDVLLFTSANQLHNVVHVAETLGQRTEFLAAAARVRIAAIGPTAAETLESYGLPVHILPEHPKMGHLVLAVVEAVGRK